MTVQTTVKALSLRPQAVGVILSKTDLKHALRLRYPPDLFELRLDGLVAAIDEVQTAVPKLRAPFIITTRSPAEGGANNLSLARRRQLLLQFLSIATYLDVELRCARALSDVLAKARKGRIGIILSMHDLNTTPPLHVLSSAAIRARSLGADIFKIATRTDDFEQVTRLLDLVQSDLIPIPISAMGFGKMGRISRLRLARAGSVLNYAHLGKPIVKGQWSLAQLRAALKPRR